MTSTTCRALIATVVASLSLACLQPADPTPVSTVVTITPRTQAFQIIGGATAADFAVILTVDVVGQRSMFLSDSWDLEKLVDQKWQIAFSSVGSAISEVVTPDHGVIFSRIIPVKGAAVESPLFDEPTGIYRVHFQMTYADGAREAIPPSQTYSPPFAVVQ